MKLERAASEVQSGELEVHSGMVLAAAHWRRWIGSMSGRGGTRGWLKPLEAKHERRPTVVPAAMVAGAGIAGWKAAESGRLTT